MRHLALPTLASLFFAMGCQPPVDATCRCIDGTGEVAVELHAFDGLGAPDVQRLDHPLIGAARYRIDLDPAARQTDDPRVFDRARVPALVEIEIYTGDDGWLRLYLPQDQTAAPLGAATLDQSAIHSPFVGGVLDGEQILLETVEVTLDAALDDARISGSFSAQHDSVVLDGRFVGETALLCKPSEPLERDARGADNGWHRPPFQESPSCLKVLHTLYGE